MSKVVQKNKTFTREQLRDHVHSIHNFIRNAGAGYGMTALKMFNIFYSLKLLDGKIGEIGLPNEYNWSSINKIKDDTLFKTLIIQLINKLRNICLGEDTVANPLKDDVVNIYDVFDDMPKTTNKQIENIRKLISNLLDKCTPAPNDNKDKVYFIYHQIPEISDNKFYRKLFNKIEELDPINNFDIKGKVYEYFIGRDESAISDLGAYFTDRHITNFIMENLPIQIINGQIPTMIDPFGGSGGMTISFANYLNTKYIDRFDWNTNFSNIHHWDMAEDVVKIAGIEYFSICNNFPSTNNFSKGNSFSCKIKPEYDFCISNPPYGGDKSKKTSEIIKKEYIIEFNKKYIESYKKQLIEELDLDTKNDIKIFNKIFDNIEKSDDLLDEYELDKNIHNEEILKIIKLNQQNEQLNKEIKDIVEKTKEEQVNYSTCSKSIKDYIKKITDSTDKLNRNRIIELCKNDPIIKSYGEALEKKSFKERQSKDYDFRDKESCSLVLLMGLLAEGGTCVGVLKEGVFFDSKYSTIRNYLVNNFNIKEIISVPQDQFENTTTKTSIIIFCNDGTTTNINFYELDVKKRKDILTKYDEEQGHIITEMKDEIYSVDKKFICSATYDEISNIKYELNKNKEPNFNISYSLNSKDYKNEIIVCPDGYELKKLSDIIEYKQKSKRAASFAKQDGKYTFYTSSDTIKKCSEQDFNDNQSKLIFGTGGRGSLFIDNKFSCSADNFVCITDNEHITLYLYLYIKYNWNNFVKNMFNGSTLGHINKERLNNLQIPFPSDISKIESLLDEIKELHELITKTENLIPIKEKEICESIKRITDNEECDEFKLGEVCEINTGDNKFSKNINSIYPVYGGGGISSYSDNYNREGFNILISRVGNFNIKFMNNKFYLNENGYTCEKVIVNKYLLGYILINNIEYIKQNYLNKTNQGVVNKTNLYKLPIKIPKNKSTIDTLQNYFDEIDELKQNLTKYNTDYKLKLDELFKDFPKSETEIEQVEEIKEETKIEETIEEIIDDIVYEPKKKSTRAKEEIIDDIVDEPKKKSTKPKKTKEDIVDEPKKKSTTKSKKIINDTVVEKSKKK
jgi:type I restriction-modification system DNA methylase subunit